LSILIDTTNIFSRNCTKPPGQNEQQKLKMK